MTTSAPGSVPGSLGGLRSDLQAFLALRGSVSDEEAAAKVRRAAEAWLAAATEAGRPAPLPRYRPALYAMEADTGAGPDRSAGPPSSLKIVRSC